MTHATTKTTADSTAKKPCEICKAFYGDDGICDEGRGGAHAAQIAARRASIAKAARFSAAAREIAAYEADIYKAKRNARVAKKGGLR